MAKFRLVCFLLLAATAFLYADPQVVLSTISQSEMRQRLNELEKMKKTKLDAHSKQMLDDLWLEASEIAEMNDRCASLSLTEMQDDECSDFYNTTLPDFETRFFQVTGEIRLNSWDLEKGVTQKGQMIQSCYDAFPLESSDPSRYFMPNGSVNPEPLVNGDVEITYRLTFYAAGNRFESVKSQMREWFRSCSPFILRNGEYEFAPMFVQLVRADDRETNSLHLEMSSDKYFKVVSTKGIKATYKLNDETLMEYVIPSGTVIFEISAWGDIESGNFLDGTSANGRIKLSKRAMRKGLMGHVEWDVSRFARASKVSTAAPSYSTERPSRYSEPEQESSGYTSSGVHLGFQFRTAIGAGIGGRVDEKLREKYSDVWSGSESIADSALVHGFWPWLLVMRVYSGSLAMGIGGGGALVWVGTNEAEGYYEQEAGDFVNLKTYVDPVGIFELGYRSVFSEDKKDMTYNLEVGVRETVLWDNEWPTYLTGGYIKLMDVLDIEIGWHYAVNMTNGAYAALNISLPPHTEN